MGKIQNLIKKEEKRQRETLMMIPSENYTYPEVRQAVGSVLMHKYSEGTVAKRYYQGNTIIDQIEAAAKNEALKAFNLDPHDWAVNVQALSGSPANLAIYNAILNPGDKILSMHLFDGGHLSHGWHVSMASKIYNVDFYHVNPQTQLLDYQAIRLKAQSYQPQLIVSGGTAYPRQIDHRKMAAIAKSVGAYYLADVSHEAGLIAASVNNSPFAHADFVMMTTHKTLRGPRGALIFCKKEFENQINRSVFPGLQGGPHNHTIAGIVIALQKAQSKSFQKYALLTIENAKILAQELQNYNFVLVSGGTDKHLILIDLTKQKISGKNAAQKLETAGIVTNANTIPNDPNPPANPSGLRIGTQALSVRGMGERQMKKIAALFYRVLILEENPKIIYKEVLDLTTKFPIRKS